MSCANQIEIDDGSRKSPSSAVLITVGAAAAVRGIVQFRGSQTLTLSEKHCDLISY